MRVNIYNEELTGDVEVVETTPETGRTFYGVRMFLASSDKLHNELGDDDRSAVTIWLHADRERAAWLAECLSEITPR